MGRGEKSWLEKNWGCALGSGCILILLFGALAIAGGAWIGVQKFKGLSPVEDAVAAANACPELVDALGQPITSGAGFQGSFGINNGRRTADVEVGIKGPAGQGRLFIEGESVDDVWSYDRLEARIDGRSDRIDLRPFLASEPLGGGEAEAPAVPEASEVPTEG